MDTPGEALPPRAVCLTPGISGQTGFPGFEKLFAPLFVIHVRVDVFKAAQLGDAFITTQSFRYDADLLLRAALAATDDEYRVSLPLPILARLLPSDLLSFAWSQMGKVSHQFTLFCGSKVLNRYSLDWLLVQ